MDKIIIENIRPWDGTYNLDLEDQPLTMLEWRWVKKISGYMPLTIDDGLTGGDPDVVCAFAAIALHRSGRVGKEQVIAVADQLADAPFDGSAIRLIADEEETITDPPSTAATEPPTPNGGESSNPTSGPSEPTHVPTGHPV